MCAGVLLGLLLFRPFSCRILCNVCLDTFMPEDTRFSKMFLVVVVGFVLTLFTIFMVAIGDSFLFLPQPIKLFVVWWLWNILMMLCTVAVGTSSFLEIYLYLKSSLCEFTILVITKLFFLPHFSNFSQKLKFLFFIGFKMRSF